MIHLLRIRPGIPAVVLVLFVVCAGCADRIGDAAFPELAGPYLGQGEPPAEPTLFAPGVVNSGLATRDVAMTPDGGEFYFGVNVGNYALSSVLVTRLVDGRWTEPETAPFAVDPRYMVMEPHVSPDGRRLFFASDRPHDGD
ncbi:PD40 domain-containing protein, partial [bacterium]|nr:PD40 domain-containing protein [bacterium]